VFGEIEFGEREFVKESLEKESSNNQRLGEENLENWRLERDRVATSMAECTRPWTLPWTRRRSDTYQQRDGAPACHMPQEVQQDSAKTSDSRW